MGEPRRRLEVTVNKYREKENVRYTDFETRYGQLPALSITKAHPSVQMEISVTSPSSLLGGLRRPYSNLNSAWNIKCSLSYESSGFLEEK